jgi:hypothetical protein
MPVILSPNGEVQIEPPNVPVIHMSSPSSVLVLVQPPGPPDINNTPSTASAAVVPVVGPQGPAGPPGAAGSGTLFEFIQTVPQSVWGPIVHNFGRFPVAWSLYDSGDRLCDEYIVEHMDINTCRVSMDVATAGVIRLI